MSEIQIKENIHKKFQSLTHEPYKLEYLLDLKSNEETYVIEKLDFASEEYSLAQEFSVSSYEIACTLMASDAEEEKEQRYDEASQFYVINTES